MDRIYFISFCTLVCFFIACLDLSFARMPYFPDPDDSLESLEEHGKTPALQRHSIKPDRRFQPGAYIPLYTRYDERELESPTKDPEEVKSKTSEYAEQTTTTTMMPAEEESVKRNEMKSVEDTNEMKSLEEKKEVKKNLEDIRKKIKAMVEKHERDSAEKSDRIERGSSEKSVEPVPCTCGIFMTGQFQKASKVPPKGNPVLMTEMEETFHCTVPGKKQCVNKCLDMLIKYLPNSPALICAAADRDIYKERAHLFVKNCEDEWHNSNLSAGREYCCKDSEMFKCPSS